MNLHLRKATRIDVPRLWQLRRDSIIELAPESMATAQAEAWAASLTVAGMEQRFLEAEIWVGETDGIIAGWIAIRGDYIDGLYTGPRYARQGVATQLLGLAERLMSERALQIIRLEASQNAVFPRSAFAVGLPLSCAAQRTAREALRPQYCCGRLQLFS